MRVSSVHLDGLYADHRSSKHECAVDVCLCIYVNIGTVTAHNASRTDMHAHNDQFQPTSKCERLLAFFIIFLTVLSFFIHLSVFTDILYRNLDLSPNSTVSSVINSTNATRQSSADSFVDIFDLNVLPLFCVMAHLIWTIVLLVVLDQCRASTNKFIGAVLFRLFICTCPLLLCHELSLVFVGYVYQLRSDLLGVMIKWLIFVAAIIVSFWTGALSDQDKWRGIHGGQIAPEANSPVYLIHQ